MQNKKRPKRIIFEVRDDIYDDIKNQCEKRGVTLRIYITRAILERIAKEKQYE